MIKTGPDGGLQTGITILRATVSLACKKKEADDPHVPLSQEKKK
jgi:hypothetical protein